MGEISIKDDRSSYFKSTQTDILASHQQSNYTLVVCDTASFVVISEFHNFRKKNSHSN